MTIQHITVAHALRVYHREAHTHVLGPHARAAIWVQGCTLACADCISPYSWRAEGGEAVPVEALADWVVSLDGVEGVTISGGEPFEQASAVAAFIDALRVRADRGVVCYSGYTLEALRRSTPERRALLARVDLLIDGRYRRERHADLRWRASTNQRLHALTPRYRREVEEALAHDCSAGLEFHLSADGRPSFVGVPPQPDFMRRFSGALEARGVALVPVPPPNPEEEPIR